MHFLTELLFLIFLLNSKTPKIWGLSVAVVDISLDCSVCSMESEIPDMDNKLL